MNSWICWLGWCVAAALAIVVIVNQASDGYDPWVGTVGEWATALVTVAAVWIAAHSINSEVRLSREEARERELRDATNAANLFEAVAQATLIVPNNDIVSLVVTLANRSSEPFYNVRFEVFDGASHDASIHSDDYAVYYPGERHLTLAGCAPSDHEEMAHGQGGSLSWAREEVKALLGRDPTGDPGSRPWDQFPVTLRFSDRHGYAWERTSTTPARRVNAPAT